MPLVEFARRRPQWLRVVLAAVLLGFAMGVITHVTHQHDAVATSVTHSVQCGYCISFGGLADAPRHTFSPAVATAGARLALPPVLIVRSVEQRISARPRAPPVS
jgi:hypothetical protein